MEETETPPINLPTESAIPDDIRIISRDDWRAQPPTAAFQYKTLPSFIRFICTGEEPCRDRASCDEEVRELQRQHMAEGLDDINYNFLISSTGDIYEGRGWKTKVEVDRKVYKEVYDTCINIVYLGNYYYGSLSWDAQVSAFNLLMHGVLTKNVSPFYDFQHLIRM